VQEDSTHGSRIRRRPAQRSRADSIATFVGTAAKIAIFFGHPSARRRQCTATAELARLDLQRHVRPGGVRRRMLTLNAITSADAGAAGTTS